MDKRHVSTAVAALCLAVSATGCAGPLVAVTTSPTSPVRARSMSPSPGTPPAASSGPVSHPVASRPAYVVAHLRGIATVDGNIYLSPPPPAIPARISAATAFGLARHRWGNPQGTAIAKLVLTSYTNDGQGTIGADNSIKLFFVQRFAWAVIDYGGTCDVSGDAPAGPGSPPPTPKFSHACLTISLVDALTGADLGSMDQLGGGTRDIATD